jgi:hypothetical protein
MSQLKIKINSNDYSFELEGDEVTVAKYFEKFEANGLPFLNCLRNSSTKIEEPLKSESFKEDNPLEEKNNKGNSILLDDIVIRQLPGPESEWILVYCYYVSENFSRKFTKNEIIDLYKKSDRWTDSTNKNFSANLKVVIKNGWIRSVGSDTYVIIDGGKEKISEIMSRTNAGKKKIITKKTTVESKQATDKSHQ